MQANRELERIQDSIKAHCQEMNTEILIRHHRQSFPIDFKSIFQKIQKIHKPKQPPLEFKNVPIIQRNNIFNLIFVWLETSKNTYFCPNCTWRFESKSDFREHLRKTHLYPKRTFIKTRCPFCDKEFHLLDKHITVQHTKEKYYKCNFCPKEFYDENSRKHHINFKHTRSTRYPCRICNKQEIYSPNRLSLHIRQNHTSLKDIIYKCLQCPKIYKNKSFLIEHIQINHEVSAKKSNTKFKCDFCDKVYDHPLRLKSHVYVKHVKRKRDYECGLCSKVFKSENGRQRHIRVHTGEAPFKCTLCIKCFKTGANLSQHLRTHSEVKPHSCALCNVSFKFRHHLKNHETTVNHLEVLRSGGEVASNNVKGSIP